MSEPKISPKIKPVAAPLLAPPDPMDIMPIIASIQHMIEHIQHSQPRTEPEDGGGQAPDAHAIIVGGHPGSTCLGTVTPFTQESQ
jgi:hypothetical protein